MHVAALRVEAVRGVEARLVEEPVCVRGEDRVGRPGLGVGEESGVDGGEAPVGCLVPVGEVEGPFNERL